ncbi:MAG: SMI1/KNR4 family protein [Alphaproteobacteria bacterium]
MQDLEKAFELIEQHFSETEKFFGAPVTQEFIGIAEEILELKFSNSYREFIKKFGYGGVCSFDIDGVTEYKYENSSYGGVVWNVLNLRENFSFPHHLIAIYNVGEGTTYCLDTSQMNESGECPVVAWPLGGYEETPVLEIVAEDFGKFFLDRVEEQIALKTKQTR